MQLWTDRNNLYHPTCYDRDSCGFFFDGFQIEMLVTSTRLSANGISDSAWAIACTMPLSEE